MYVKSSTHTGSVQWQYRLWVWKSFTRGLNTVFMDLHGAAKIGDKDVATCGFVGDWAAQHDTVRRNMGYTRAGRPDGSGCDAAAIRLVPEDGP